MLTQPSADTIGMYWQDDQGNLWRQISYSAAPTASFQLVNDPFRMPTQPPQTKRGVVGSPLLADLRLLGPES